MKVKVIWRNNNPFCPNIEDMGRKSEADVGSMTMEQIEEYAKEATPLNFHLAEIDTPDRTYFYDMNGNRIGDQKR